MQRAQGLTGHERLVGGIGCRQGLLGEHQRKGVKRTAARNALQKVLRDGARSDLPGRDQMGNL